MHEKAVPLYNEKRLLAVLYMVGLEKNSPKPNCEVTKCPTQTESLKIFFLYGCSTMILPSVFAGDC